MENCSFAVNLGDLIQDDKEEKDWSNYLKGLELFAASTCPIHHVVGNHDTKHLALSRIRKELGLKSLYYSFDEGGFHFVVLYSHVPVQEEERSYITEEQLDWLSADLESDVSPTVVFVHHSLAEQDLTGNPWFEGRPAACLISNRAKVREILESSGRVVAVFNGHLHWNQATTHNGIAYYTLQSATENFKDDGTPANTWGLVELRANELSFQVFGNDAANYTHTFDLEVWRSAKFCEAPLERSRIPGFKA